MEAFYETLATNMQNFDYPIITLQDLAPRGSTCPASAYELYEQDTIKKIGRALYQKLLGVIPSTCTILHNLLANHSATQDGYRALYAMMRLKCAYLQDLLPTWGPEWQKATTAFEYVSTLQSYLTQERRRNKTYTEFEIAAEMVQQAKRHPEYQLLAGAYMAQLIALPTDTANMTPEFLHENLALNFESNRQNSIPHNPSINKFGQRGGPSDRKQGEPQRHQYKNPVQCGSCKLFGHCIDSQVCRFSAQFMYAKEYVEKNPDKARANADAYCAANNKTTVNKIYQQFPEKFDDEMTETEREDLRYEMATTFYSQSKDDSDP
jgi:ferredoxin